MPIWSTHNTGKQSLTISAKLVGGSPLYCAGKRKTHRIFGTTGGDSSSTQTRMKYWEIIAENRQSLNSPACERKLRSF
jgi:hypothetical protein